MLTNVVVKHRKNKVLSKPLSSEFSFYTNFGKRVCDILFIVLTLPFILPLIVILMALTALDGHNPVYSQTRIGRHGRHFTIWKLRTMVPNADQQLASYLAENAQAATEWATTQKLKNDPRITAFGRIMRKSSLDELPQLWNVLVGEMSLVGPRPMLPEQQELYPSDEYYSMRPGLTCTWQISDRNNSTFSARACFDAEYSDTISLKTDCRILASTIGVVMNGTGY